jgi:hypothetical protein
MPIPANSYIVLQAYGDEGIFNECAFALLSLCRQHTKEELQNVEIWIYTDKASFFKTFEGCWLNIRFREINASLIKKWKGSIDFVHRVKIEVLRHFTEANEGQVLYLDTDVYFSNSLSTIFSNISQGRLYMHVLEGQVHNSSNLVLRKLSRFIKNKSFSVNGKQVTIPQEVTMWNAGVLGFHTRHKHLLDDILAFTDVVYAQFPKHVIEQFAFSLYFQQTSPLLSANKEIHHYWNTKELRSVLSSFFRFFIKKDWDELVVYSALIQPADLMQQKINFLKDRSITQKLRKKQWQPELPDWNLLAQQL